MNERINQTILPVRVMQYLV